VTGTNLAGAPLNRWKQRLMTFGRGMEDRLHRWLRGRRRRVLFDGETSLHFSMFTTLYGALRQAPGVQVRFTSSWEGGLKVPLQAAAAVLGAAVTEYVPYQRAKWAKWDLYVSSCFDNPWFARAVPWVDTFHGVGEKWVNGGRHLYMVHPLAARYDRLLCPNERLAQHFRAHPEWLKSPEALRVTGMARSDFLVWFNTPEMQAVLRAEMGLDGDRPTVLFAPTWGRHGVLARYGEEVIRECLRRDLNVIVKLHACSYLSLPKYSGGINWRERLSAFENDRRFRHLPHGNLTALILLADVMVADFGSAPVEFCLVDRPLIFWKLAEQAEHTGGDHFQFEALCAAGGGVSDMAGFRDRLERILSNRDEAAAARRHLREVFFFDAGQATENCLREMCALMETELPADLVARFRSAKRLEIQAAPAHFLGNVVR